MVSEQEASRRPRQKNTVASIKKKALIGVGVGVVVTAVILERKRVDKLLLGLASAYADVEQAAWETGFEQGVELTTRLTKKIMKEAVSVPEVLEEAKTLSLA